MARDRRRREAVYSAALISINAPAARAEAFERVADGVSVTQLRQRARYWRLRAKGETDPQKRAKYHETAAILDREADAIKDAEYEELVTRRPEKRAGN